VLLGWKSVSDADTYLPYHFDPRPDAAKFESGTPSTLGTVALGAALDLILEVGPDIIEQRCMELTQDLAEGLRGRGAEIVSPWEETQRSGIVVFRLPTGDDPSVLCAALNADGIVVRVRNRGIRVAPHFYNDSDDVERFFAAIDRHVG
jgi:selenocysteine lyase/cysteine desulfurase